MHLIKPSPVAGQILVVTGISILLHTGCSPSQGTMEKWIQNKQEGKLIEYIKKCSTESNNGKFNTKAITTATEVATRLKSNQVILALEELVCSESVDYSIHESILNSFSTSGSSPLNIPKLSQLYFNSTNRASKLDSLRVYLAKANDKAIYPIFSELFQDSLSRNDLKQCLMIASSYARLNDSAKTRLAETIQALNAQISLSAKVEAIKQQMSSDATTKEQIIEKSKGLESKLLSDGKEFNAVRHLHCWLESQSKNDTNDSYQVSYCQVSELSNLGTRLSRGTLSVTKWQPEEKEYLRNAFYVHGREAKVTIHATNGVDAISKLALSQGVMMWNVVESKKYREYEDLPRQIKECKDKTRMLDTSIKEYQNNLRNIEIELAANAKRILIYQQ